MVVYVPKLISVIVPVYNCQDFIGRCLESLRNQTYKNIEVIIVDDGSTDGSFEVYSDYVKTDKRFKVVRQNNLGLSGARNRGLDEAIGQYIAFVDSDDYCSENFFEDLLKDLILSNADVAVSSVVDVFPSGKYVPKISPKEHSVFTSSELLRVALSLRDSNKYATMGGFSCNKLFRKEIIETSGSRFEFIKGAEDEVFLSNIICNIGKVVFVPCAKYFYYQRDNSLSKRSDFYMHFLDSRIYLYLNNYNDSKFAPYYRAALFQAVVEQFFSALIHCNKSVLANHVIKKFKTASSLVCKRNKYSNFWHGYIRRDLIYWFFIPYFFIFVPNFIIKALCYLYLWKMSTKRR